jgi:hypothetical protein
MKTISLKHYALSVCAAAAMLVDCGGPLQFPNSDVQAPLNARRTDVIASASRSSLEALKPDSARIELLAAESKGHCKRSHSGLFGSCDFKASGTAAGPYPGTFTANGNYYFCEFYCMWTFGESFTITSGTAKISGTISALGGGLSPPFPAFYPYESSFGDGRVKIEAVGPDGAFREKLHRL